MELGFFFGAGAEIGYGLPSGGRFAIDIFRQDPSKYKIELREQLRALDSRSAYASDWLPSEYAGKSIYAFGRNEFTSLIESSIEYKRTEIIRRLNQFDQECDAAITQLGIDKSQLEQKFTDALDSGFGERLYTHAIRLNELLSRDVRLFDSEYYSAILDVVRTSNQNDDLKRYASAFMQLLVGAHGQALVQRLNQELFEEAPDDLPIFDDIVGMFRIEFSRIGSTALELLLEEDRVFETNDDSSALTLLCAIAQKVLENIFTTVLDYQKLIDDHFRYLFSPATEWAKFTRMVIFLKIARDYISSQAPSIESLPEQGYYHDLARANNGIDLTAVGTANYNSLLAGIFSHLSVNLPEIIHLNGSINDYYNPYKNSVITCRLEDLDQEQIHVPFILTQSGLKPLTSVEMSRRYVTLFDKYADSDAVVVVGFGFNKDDSHINGLFRELVENKGRRLIIITLNTDGTAEEQKRKLRSKMRISHEYNHLIHIITVDGQTRTHNDTLWLDAVINLVNQLNE
ncbi:hypothetical protein ACQFZT_001807 [Providencia stuartii]|uniref:hypothetical protein n=1 Tax=Providencia stuartii TaxID=588 RepID=UPI0028C137E2|nr:hypothetical protein [Providencia stuartii]MDT7051476.1 hypothetical protein [Providencia stuartii]